MATFSVAFLGCKVSHVDAHAVRERLLADGHTEQDGGADVAVVNTCCVTHEAVSKSRQAARRLARTHGRVYVTGCGANLPPDAFAGLAPNVVVVPKRNEELLAALRETPIASRHLHVPLQSGDDGVLSAMSRRYGAGTYLRRVALAAGFNLTTDVIVGFPTEDERAFRNTLAVVAEAGITKAHVFPYSPRPGTRTAADDRVPRAVKRERSERLRALSREQTLRRWHEKIGEPDVVLVDRPGR